LRHSSLHKEIQTISIAAACLDAGGTDTDAVADGHFSFIHIAIDYFGLF